MGDQVALAPQRQIGGRAQLWGYPVPTPGELRALGQGVRAFGTMARNRYNRYRGSNGRFKVKSQSRSRGRSGGPSGGAYTLGVSKYRDAKLGYRYRRMPRRQRMRWRRYSKKVDRVIDNRLATHQFVFTDYKPVAGVADTQNYLGIDLLGYEDMGKIIANMGEVPTPPLKAGKLTVHSQRLEADITNMSTDFICLDIYECIARVDSAYAEYANITSCWQNGFSKETSIGTFGPNAFGVTPFQNADFCKHWKIMKKYELSLEAGAFTTLKMKSHKDTYVNSEDVYPLGGDSSLRYKTRGIIMIARCNPQVGTPDFDVSIRKYFNVKVLLDNDTLLAVNP